jgi:hypothetical protein
MGDGTRRRADVRSLACEGAGMQFNFVVSTEPVRLWQSLGFAVAGRLPGAFAHPTLGYVDALVMYRDL